MISNKVNCFLIRRSLTNVQHQPQRAVQISILNAASDIGTNLALLLRRNQHIQRLHLHDDDEKLTGTGLELNNIPSGPQISTFVGDSQLCKSIECSKLIVLLSKNHHKPGPRNDQLLQCNAPWVYKTCVAMVRANPDAIFASAMNPVNSIIPLASTLLFKFNCYNPYRTLGITQIDSIRARSFAGNILKANAKEIRIPVIGGHSDETIIPLFSNMEPLMKQVNEKEADRLTSILRKAANQSSNRKAQDNNVETLTMAWSLNEFINGMALAFLGHKTLLHCYCANPYFGTRYFAGPATLDATGIINNCKDFNMSQYELFMLQKSIYSINKDIQLGERMVPFVESTICNV